MCNTLYWVVPGDITTHSGGYAYNRQVISRLRQLRFQVHLIQLSGSFPFPDTAALISADQQLAALPDEALVIIDGLALGAMPSCAEKHAARLILLALCHHPLALETGLTQTQAEYFYQAERRALAAVQGVLVTSATTADYLIQHFYLQAEKIKVALPGTTAVNFAKRAGNPPILLTVASFIPRKGHDLLIAALEKLADIPWQACWVGNTQLNPDWFGTVQQQITKSSIAHRIQLLGDCADTQAHYAAADLFVLPSAYEGYGMAFAEALASGLPIIATNTGAPAQWLPGSACQLVAADDVQALAAALRHVLLDKNAAQGMATAARAAASTLPRWEDTAEIIGIWLQQFIERR